MEAIKKIISNKKAAAVLRITCYILGIITVLAGGVKLMAMIMTGIFGFLLGKYVEKIFSIIKDWRLAQKFNRISVTSIEYENMKKELEEYKQILKNINKSGPAPRRTHNVPYDYYPEEEMEGGYYR